MSVLDRSVAIDTYLRQTLATVGILAEADGKTGAAAACLDLASAFGEHETFPVGVKIDAMLCALCDHLRQSKLPDLVAKAERVIALVKAGEPQRVLVGGVNFHAETVGQLDDQLEHIHRVGARIIGG